jgi:glutathione S-transferase
MTAGMQLHMHPVSTSSRTVALFFAEHSIPHEAVVVDLLTGEHVREPFTKLNPSAMVPVLVDGDFVLTESSSILKYAADKHGSAAYPTHAQQRARVNERMDWFNSNLYRDWGYHLIYPQVYSTHQRPTPEGQAATVEWGREKSEMWLGILDRNILGNRPYLCGDQLTIADYFGAEILSAGDLIGASFRRYPNVDRWMSTMRALPSWKTVNAVSDGFAASLREKTFVTIG